MIMFYCLSLSDYDEDYIHNLIKSAIANVILRAEASQYALWVI